MILVLPDVSTTLGPEWASLLNEALQAVDSHDHSPGSGALISQTGIYINGDLTLNNSNLTDAKSVRLQALAAALSGASDKRCVYSNGGDLYYNNAAGAAVQLTSGGAIASTGSGVVTASAPSSYPYTVISGDAQKVLLIDTASARTLNLPAATTAMYFMVKDSVGSGQTNNITIHPAGTDTIDGSNSNYLIDANYGSIGLISDGVSKWLVV